MKKKKKKKRRNRFIFLFLEHIKDMENENGFQLFYKDSVIW